MKQSVLLNAQVTALEISGYCPENLKTDDLSFFSCPADGTLQASAEKDPLPLGSWTPRVIKRLVASKRNNHSVVAE
jgi:hypothetical protein